VWEGGAARPLPIPIRWTLRAKVKESRSCEMKLIIIFGPAAVGKMTVGIELAKLIDFKLFHNHVIVDALYDYYTFKDKQLFTLTSEFRQRLFQEFGKSNFKGIIFTYVWALNEQADHDELLKYINQMNVKMDDVFFVELEATQKIRIERNKSELRLNMKKAKRNIPESENFIYESEKNYKLNSNNDFIYPQQHMKICNTDLNAEDAAKIINIELGRRKFT
jgi:hypothetical protein